MANNFFVFARANIDYGCSVNLSVRITEVRISEVLLYLANPNQ